MEIGKKMFWHENHRFTAHLLWSIAKIFCWKNESSYRACLENYVTCIPFWWICFFKRKIAFQFTFATTRQTIFIRRNILCLPYPTIYTFIKRGQRSIVYHFYSPCWANTYDCTVNTCNWPDMRLTELCEKLLRSNASFFKAGGVLWACCSGFRVWQCPEHTTPDIQAKAYDAGFSEGIMAWDEVVSTRSAASQRWSKGESQTAKGWQRVKQFETHLKEKHG